MVTARCPAHLIKINMLGCGSYILPTVNKAFVIETQKGTQMLSAKWFVSGVSLAVTVGAAYTACALVFWIWPETAVNLMNALFHGMDFRRLRAGPTLFDFGAFTYALVIFMGWAFLLGASYAAMSQALGARQRA